MKKEVFLISSSRFSGSGGVFFAHCLEALSKFLGPAVHGHNKVAFVPFAHPDCDYEGYTKIVSEPFAKIGYEVISVNDYMNHKEVISKPDVVAVFVGGGNTWVLLNELCNQKYLRFIRDEVVNGRKKYIGSSAGTVVACPTIMTTNDMAPVCPPSFDALKLIPFQINPHFVPGALVEGHQGEPREERIRQVINFNSEIQVVGLPEGCWIEGIDEEYTLGGTGKAVIFRKGRNNSVWLPREPFDKDGML